MAKIQGVTIELSADATGIEQALSDVNKQANKTTKELGQINQALKFDPGNTTLLSQKFEVLQDTISNTSTKLDALKKAQADLDAQAASGKNIAPEQFRALAREIEQTEGMLRSFKNQAENVQVRLGVQADTSGIDKMKNALKELGPAAKDAAKEIGSALGNAGAAAAAGIGALVVGSTDLNNDLARLRTNATLAGNDLGLVESAFEQITAVTGETDSAVETVSNLLASGFKDNQLQTAIEGINGAAIKFSDTLNTEGIADGIQETFATGEAIGMFAELLERSGVDLEDFNAKLAVAKKNGTEADLALQTLSELGLTEVSDKYKELNPELVANNEATVQMQTALADLAIVLTPLVTTIAELVTQFVEWATANPELVTTLGTIAGVVAGIAGAFGLLSPIISAAAGLWGVLSGAVTALLAPIGTAVGALGGLSGVFSLLTGPIGIAIGAIVAIVGALVVAYNKVEWFRDGVNEIWNKIKDYTSQAFNAVKDLVVDLIGSAVEFGKESLDKFKVFWDENGEAITALVKTHFGKVKDNIETVMGFIKGIFEVVWPLISGIVKTSWEFIELTIGTAIDLILGIIEVAMKLLQGDWEGAWESIKRTAETIMRNILSFFKSIDLYQIGKDMIQGLINGIGSMKDFVVGIIEDTIGSAIDFAKKLLGIASPSKVFFEIGEWTGEGLALGLNEMEKQVIKSSGNLANAVQSAYMSLATSDAKSREVAANSNVNTTTNNRTFAPVINNYGPDSDTRAQERMLKRLAIQFN